LITLLLAINVLALILANKGAATYSSSDDDSMTSSLAHTPVFLGPDLSWRALFSANFKVFFS